MNQITINVRYPPGKGTIALRTEHDWDRTLEPDSYDEESFQAAFLIDTERPHFYFKPVLLADGEEMAWARGGNYLAIMNVQPSRNVYPHFYDERGSTICEKFEPPSFSSDSHAVRIFLPPGYEENTLKRYPVLYMQDAHNLFFPHEAFTGEHWRISETLDILTSMNIIRKSIVVGIYPNDRLVEFTNPGYEEYGRYVVDDLKPLVDARYRTLKDRENTAVMGSSLGGVVSFFLAWQYPDVFGKAACMSSTFGFRDDLMERVRREDKPDLQLYLDSGWPEDNYEATRTMRDLLLKQGFESGRDLLYFAFPNALHNERYWAMRSHIPFQYFFGKVPHGE